jgi:hypothetical protein
MDKDYYETFDKYQPRREDFYDNVAALLPSGWTICRSSIWYQCKAQEMSIPAQGWKIHVSTAIANAAETLHRVTTVLLARGDAAFKFAADCQVLLLLNSKNWSRSAAGKFITIYPHDSETFISLIDELHRNTRDLAGPYILSDRRYKDSNVIFYRYGGMTLNQKLNIKGERIPVIVAPDGSTVPDRRCAYPATPDWVTPLFPEAAENDVSAGGIALQNGRYTVTSALRFSNAGGIYLAHDNQTGSKVLIKEARPCINSTKDGYDAVELLKKEFRLLATLSDLGVAPRPVDLFREGEHWFLAEELIEGLSMSAHSAVHSLLLRTRPSPDDLSEWYDMFRSLSLSLTDVLEKLHSRNIVFNDLSPNNLIVVAGTHELKLVDFEAAYQIGVDRPTLLYTPGFASQSRLAGGAGNFEEDCYALGSVLLAYLLPLNGLYHLHPNAKREFMEQVQIDAGLPPSLVNMLLRVTSQDAQDRPGLQQIRVTLQEAAAPALPVQTPRDGADIDCLVRGIAAHIEQVASYEREDRLFPPDQRMFATNPLSLAYGAAGVAYALLRVTGRVPESAINWILRHKVTCDEYPPGLYIGLAGIAWSLMEAGQVPAGERLMKLSSTHSLLHESPDLFYGQAGWGMACLRFFTETQDQIYLDWALDVGDKLVRQGRQCRFIATNDTPLGLAHGSTGIALFLLYLHLATFDESFLAAGLKALEFDLDFGRPTKDGGLSWPASELASSPLYPYWRMGSAGVGQAVLRYYRVLRDPRFLSILERIFVETDRKYAVLPGRFTGLAGLGDFLLDMYDTFGDARYLSSAWKVAGGIHQFRVERSGIAFPGDLLARLTCDYGTGSAGIALFLHRLIAGGEADFMLDRLMVHRPDQVREREPVGARIYRPNEDSCSSHSELIA